MDVIPAGFQPGSGVSNQNEGGSLSEPTTADAGG
jgi:hypothetical protein